MSKFLEGNVPTKLFPRDNKKPSQKVYFLCGLKNNLTNTKLFARATIDLRRKSLKYIYIYIYIFGDKSYSKIQRKIKRNA